MELYPSTLGTGKALISGTPAANQVAFWSSTTAITGDAGITYTAAGGLVINDASGSAVDLRAEAETMPNMFFLDADVQMVFMSDAATGGTVAAPTGGWIAGTMLVLDNRSAASDSTYLAIMAGATSGTSGILFGDTNDADVGALLYDHGTNICYVTVSGTKTIECTVTEVVINQNSYENMDFRCEGNNLDHLFFVDSSQDIVFITDATTVPTAPTGGFTAGTLLAIQNNSAVGDDAVLALIAGTSGNSMIDFGDADSATAGRIDYSHAGSFTFTTESLEVCRMYGTTGLTVNENAAAACDFRVETENMPNFLFVDSSADRMYLTDGAGFHTPPTVTGGYSTGALLVVQNSSASGDDAIVSLIAATDGESIVEFGDTGDANVGWIKYNHTSNYVSIGAAAGEKAVMASSGDWHFRGNSPDAVVHVSCPSDYGKQCMTIDQNDADQVFIDYQGTSAASAANNISTWTAGNSIQGFVKVEINGTPYWMPYYDAPTS